MEKLRIIQFSSVQFSCSVISDSLRPHDLQHTKLDTSMITKNGKKYMLLDTAH